MKSLTTIDNVFIDRLLAGDTKANSMREALRAGGIDKAHSNKYLHLKAIRLLEKDRIMKAINTRKQVMEANANLAAQRLQTIITEGKDADAIKAGIFSIEQVDGKAGQTLEVNNNTIKLSIDLAGALEGSDTPLLES